MIKCLVKPRNVTVAQGGNFHRSYSTPHRACKKKLVACNHSKQTLAGILSAHTHTHTPSLTRALFAHSCRASSGFMRGKDMLYYATVYRFSTAGSWPTSCSLRDGRRFVPASNDSLQDRLAKRHRTSRHAAESAVVYDSLSVNNAALCFRDVLKECLRRSSVSLWVLTDSEEEKTQLSLLHLHTHRPPGKLPPTAQLTRETSGCPAVNAFLH